MLSIIDKKKEELISICKSNRVQRLYVFGSVVSDRFNDNSDIDFLISFADDLTVTQYTDNYFLLHYQLRDLFQREIDIITERTLSNPFFIESINESKMLIYEA